MNKLVRVSARDIREAYLGHGFCPIEIACRRFKRSALVGDDRVTWKGLQAKVSLPSTARRFVQDFDDGKPVKPFSFYLDVPE
jgi:hypothetical protein